VFLIDVQIFKIIFSFEKEADEKLKKEIGIK
jgi:hypothetical protein